MHIEVTELSARVVQRIIDEAPDDMDLMVRAQKIIQDTYAAGCSFHAYGDAGLGTGYGPRAKPDPHGAEIVANPALFHEIRRQMLIIQGPKNTIPSVYQTERDREIAERHRAGEAWAASRAE